MSTNKSLKDTYSVLNKKKNRFPDLDYFNSLAINLGASDVFQINPEEDLIFEERVRLLCANNCSNYGKKLSCPPNIPPLNYKNAIQEYEKGLLVLLKYSFDDSKEFQKKRIESTNNLHRLLLSLERESFKKGYFLSTSFIGGSCKLCGDCAPFCKYPSLSRIPLEATGINVIRTLENLGVNLHFPVFKYKNFSRVGLLLVGD